MTYQRSSTPLLNDTAGTSINLAPRRGAGPGGGPRRSLSGLGATSGGSAANVALRALQAVVNRFADVGNFSPIAVDGGMGGDTENATQNALFVASQQGFGEDLLAGLNASFSSGGGQTFIMQHIPDISTTLTAVANSMGLPAEIKPSPITTLVAGVTNLLGGGPKTPGAPSAAGSLTDVVKNMPTAMKLTLAGLGIGIGYFAFFDKKKSRRK